MKKLKLQALELGAKEVLSRVQLKNVLGGSGSDGGSGINLGASCSSGPCSLTIQNKQTGAYSTFPGNCAGSVMPIGTVVGSLLTCYCNAVGAPVPLSSNGGTSKCGAGGIIYA